MRIGRLSFPSTLPAMMMGMNCVFNSPSVGSTTNLVGVFTASLVGASDLSLTGAVGGGQIGYNWQFNPNWLVGVEVDYDWTGQRGGALFNDPLVAVRETVEAKLNWLATIRARFGYITGNSLWYVTGGWADGRRELHQVARQAIGNVDGSVRVLA